MFSALINSCVESGTHTIPLGIHSSNRNKTRISGSFFLIRVHEVLKIIAQSICNLKRKKETSENRKQRGFWVECKDLKAKTIYDNLCLILKLPSGPRRLRECRGGLVASQLCAQSPATPSRLHDIISTQIKGFSLASEGKGTGSSVLGAPH